MSDTKKRWLSSGYLKSAPTGEIDHERGIIEGVSVCTAGEAKGHDVHLDQEFIETVQKFGSEKKQGLKARFGHPNMCSTALGTFIGRFKNFKLDGAQVRADLFLSNEAKDTPHGNLYDYVLGMADNEPDMFGTSIVFTPGREYRRDSEGDKWFRHTSWSWGEPSEWYEDANGDKKENADDLSEELFVECAELHACDAVDDPAANDGLFSRFSNETIAGQVTEFLDLHPQVWEAVSGNPEIIKALANHAEKIDEFFAKYSEYKSKIGDSKMNEKKKPNSEKLDAENQPAVEPESPKTENPATTAPAESEPVENKAAQEPAKETQQEAKQIDSTEFAAMVKTFGAEIAAKVALSGGGMTEALKLQVEALRSEKEQLAKKLSELGEDTGGEPANPSMEATNPKSIFKKNR